MRYVISTDGNCVKLEAEQVQLPDIHTLRAVLGHIEAILLASSLPPVPKQKERGEP